MTGQQTSLLAFFFLVSGAWQVAGQQRFVGGIQQLYPWPRDPRNLARNGSFEHQSGGLLLDWRVGQSSFLFPDTATHHSGYWSLHLKNSHLSRTTPTAAQSLSLAPGWYMVSSWARASGAGANAAGSGGRLTVKTQFSGIASTPAIRGTTNWQFLSRSFLVESPEPGASVRIEAYRKPSGHIYFDDVGLNRLVPPVVEGFLLYPNYRGMLFDDLSQRIELHVIVRPEEARLKLSDIEVRLALENSAGRVALRAIRPTLREFTTNLDASSVGLGTWDLRLWATRVSDGRVIFEYPRYKIAKLAASERARLGTYVDAAQSLVLKGKPRFVLGIYDSYYYPDEDFDARLSKIAEAPLDLYLNYWLHNSPQEKLTTLMNVLQSHGMSYLHTVNTWHSDLSSWRDSWRCNGQTALRLGEEGFVGCMARTLGTHPALAGWYTADERSTADLGRVFDQYKVLRSNEPGGVTFIAQKNYRELVRWRDATDAFDVHDYPIFNVPEGTLSPLSDVYHSTRAAWETVKGKRPVWAVIQFFQNGSKGHFPTDAELRSMSYLAVIAGARGLFYWSYGAKGISSVADDRLREVYWQRLVRLTREIKSLEPVLISPDAPRTLVQFSPSNKIRVLTKRLGNTSCVLAASIAPDSRVPARFTLADGFSGTIEVVGERRRLQAVSGTFSDMFGPYGVHVYRTVRQ